LAFKTGDGGIGILRILGFTEDRRGIRIRYKLARQPKAGRSATTPPDDAVAESDNAEGWGQPLDGLRCCWIPSTVPVRVGTKPMISMEVENTSDKPILWNCASGITLGVSQSEPAGGYAMPKFSVHPSHGARLARPDYYRIEPTGRVVLTAECPWEMDKVGTAKIYGTVFRVHPITDNIDLEKETRVRCPPLILSVAAAANGWYVLFAASQVSIHGFGSTTWGDGLTLATRDGTILWTKDVKHAGTFVVGNHGTVAMAEWVMVDKERPGQPRQEDSIEIQLFDVGGERIASRSLGDGKKNQWYFSAPSIFAGAFGPEDKRFYYATAEPVLPAELCCLDRSGRLQWKAECEGIRNVQSVHVDPDGEQVLVVGFQLAESGLRPFAAFDRDGKLLKSGKIDPVKKSIWSQVGISEEDLKAISDEVGIGESVEIEIPDAAPAKAMDELLAALGPRRKLWEAAAVGGSSASPPSVTNLEAFRLERTRGEQATGFDAKLRHFRTALSWNSDHPEKVALEYRVAVMLKEVYDSGTATWPRRKEALAMFRGIVDRYDHTSYYTNTGANSPWEAEVVVPQAAIRSAVLLAQQGGDAEEVARYWSRALEMMNQTCRRRIREWSTAPRPEPPHGPFDGPREQSKWQSRVAEWERRKEAAAKGEVLSVSELRTLEGSVPSIDVKRGGQTTHEILARLRQIAETYRGTPIARIAQQRLEAAKGDPVVLLGQLNAGELSDEEIRRITGQVLAIQADPEQPWDGAWGNWLEKARVMGKVSDADFTLYAQQSDPIWQMEFQQAMDKRSGRFGLSFGYKHVGGRVASGTTNHNLIIRYRFHRLSLDELSFDVGTGGGEWSFAAKTGHGGGNFWVPEDIDGLEKLRPGKYEAVLVLEEEVYETGRPDKTLYHRWIELKDEVELSELLFTERRNRPSRGEPAGVSIRGRVIGIDGKPAVGYDVTASPEVWSAYSGAMPPTTTDERGAFSFRNLPDGPCDVSATANPKTNQPNIRIENVALKKGHPVDVTLSLEQKYSFGGRFTDAAGRPQPDRNVLAIWKDPTSGATYSSNTKTDANGRYRFASPFEVAERVLINDGGSRYVSEQKDVKHGREDVDFQLTADKDRNSRDDVSNPVQIEIPPTNHAITEAEGPEHSTRERQASRKTTVRGKVLGADGKPLAGVPLAVKYLDQRRNWAEGRQIQSDEQGEFTISGLSPGEIFICYEKGSEDVPERTGDAQMFISHLQIGDGEVVENVTVDLSKATCALEGRLVDHKGNGIAGASVQALYTPSWVAHYAWTKTDEHGRYRIAGLPPHEFEVFAHSKDHYGRPGERIKLEPGETRTINMLGYIPGHPAPEPEPDDPRWGEPSGDLRAAIELRPGKESYELGEIVEMRPILRNTGEKTVTLIHDFALAAELRVTDEAGKAQTFSYKTFLGDTVSTTYVLKPGHEIEMQGQVKLKLLGADYTGDLIQEPGLLAFPLKCRPGAKYKLSYDLGDGLRTGEADLVISDKQAEDHRESR